MNGVEENPDRDRASELPGYGAGASRFRLPIGFVVVCVAVAAAGWYVFDNYVKTASIATRVKRTQPLAQSVTCDKRGIIAFAGTSTNVYDCNLVFAGADVWRCYVRVKGDIYEVTREIKALRQVSPAEAEGFNCATSKE